MRVHMLGGNQVVHFIPWHQADSGRPNPEAVNERCYVTHKPPIRPTLGLPLREPSWYRVIALGECRGGLSK